MAFNKPNAFTFNFKEVVIEEIALEGLQGIGIDLLWRRIEHRISSPLTEKMEIRFWNFITSCESIYLYDNPTPLPHVELVDRFTLVVPETGDLKEPDDYLDGQYEYCPIEKDNGSCQYYKTRTLLDKATVAQMTYKEVLKTFGDNLIMVASKEERWHALAPHMPYSCISELSTVHYCILELVGKARENGQLTIGKTNLTKINKDSKLLFYNRKTLQDLDLVRVTYITQVTTGRGAVKGILLRLKKFHKSFILTVPRVGPIHNLVSYLKEQPNYCEKTEVILKKGLLSQKQNKRFQKKFYIFGFEEKPISNVELVVSKNRPKPHTRRRYIYLRSNSDESSNSEEEDAPTPLKCQYKVGISILRQSYERILEAGLKGLTKMELSEIVGMEFYISRTICRIFKSKNLVREFLEDRGRQRTARYIAVAATAKMDVEYAEALKKFENFLSETHSLESNKKTNDTDSDSEHLPSKRIKLETESQDIDDCEESDITELKFIEGIPKVSAKSLTGNNRKTLSLRQLKFANGLLKLIREKKYVAGYQSLSRQIGLEIGEPPMDNKALKIFLQKLLIDGQLRVLRIKWPGFQTKCSTLICAPDITASHPIIKAKYKEIVKRAARNKEIYRKVTSGARPLTLYAYPRYIKVQKLHEAVMNFVYFENVKSEFDDNLGFVYLKDLIPELTVQVALGLISSSGAIDLKKFSLCDALLDVKLRDAPVELSKVLIKSVNLYNSVCSLLRVLALFGLVQLIALTPPQTTKTPDQSLGIHLIYANRHARILDTSGIWPKQKINVRLIEKEFYFKTFEDVADYWSTVYNVSTNTTIDLPGRSNNKCPKAPVRTTHEVFDCDNGQIYGDGLGACGFDSSFYIDMPRLWRAYCTRLSKPMKQPVKIPKVERVKKRQVVRKRRNVFEEHEKPPPVKPSTSKQTTNPKQPTRKRAPSPLFMRAQKKSYESQLWTAVEDRVLLLCKVAINIMSPAIQPGCVRLRNLVAKDILALKDPRKTQKVCHRRAVNLETVGAHTREKDCLLTELKRRYSIIKNYEGLLKKLRILNYSNMSKFINEARLPLMELVWIAHEVHKTKSFAQITPNIKLNSEDFHEQYSVLTMSINRPGNMYKTPHNDISTGTLKEAIALTVMLSYKNDLGKENAAKIYHFFARYDEKVLRQAVEQLRKSGGIVAKEKTFNGQMHKANLDDIVQCCYKISAVYQRKWSQKFNYLDHLANCVDMDSNENDLKSTPPVNCFAFEQNANGVLEINVTSLPVINGFSGTLIQEDQLNAIDIETKYKLKSATVGWRKCSSVSSFSDLYKDINTEELQCLRRSVVSNEGLFKTNTKNRALEVEDKILAHLSSKREKGATFQEIKALCGCDTKTLIEILTQLEEEQFLKRVGFYENVVVLTEHFKAWAFLVGDLYILPSPWFNIDGSIRVEIFFNWATTLMNNIFDCPGSTVTSLADGCEFLSSRSVQDICDIMKSFGCVILRTMIKKEVSLFSEDDDEPLEFESYNPYESPDNIYVFPVKDSLSKYATVKKQMLNKNS